MFRPNPSSSSSGKGARRAWGLACVLFLLSACWPVMAEAVPPGTPISNTAQASFGIWGIPASAASNTATLLTVRANTPSQIELLQYAPLLAGAQLVDVPSTAYDPDGTAGGATQQIPAVYPAGSTTAIDLSQPVPLIQTTIYHQGEPLFIQAADADQNTDAATRQTLWVLVTSVSMGDSELLLLTESGPDSGIFIGCLQSNGLGPMQSYNGVLDVTDGEQISVQYTDQQDASDTSTTSALVDPFGLVFDSATGQPVNDVQLTLVADATGLPAAVFGDDGVSAFPSTIASGGTFTDGSGKVYAFAGGHYRFPFVAPGTYRLVISAPAGYTAPSAVSTAMLQALPGGPFVIAEPGSRGEVFILNPGPAVRMDIPVDPSGTGLWLRKTASRETAAIGDFVQYSVMAQNNSGALAAGVRVVDRLPAGFRYVKGSARTDGYSVDDPQFSADGRTLTFNLGDLAAGRTADLHYVVEIAAGARKGKAVNRARAANSAGLSSNSAEAPVTVKEDLFRSENVIIGRIIAGNCGEPPTDKDDGVAGVRVYLEDGTYVVTDEQGRYHFEGVSSGTHVVQIDTQTLPDVFEVVVCEEDSRSGGTPFSRFTELNGGALWRVDFHVRTKTPPSGQVGLKLPREQKKRKDYDQADRLTQGRVEKDRPDQAQAPQETAPVQTFDQIDMEALAPELAWVMPRADFLPPIPSVKLAVSHPPQCKVELLLNGQALNAVTFEGVRLNAAGTIAVSQWGGVGIVEGRNYFTAVCKDAQGREVRRIERIISYAGPPVRAALIKSESRLVANGQDAPVIAIRLTDKNGMPARFGVVGEYTVLPPHQPYIQGRTVEHDNALTRPQSEKTRYSIGADGIARIRLQPTTRSGYAVVRIPLNTIVQEFRVWLAPEPRDWILVGLAEGTVGYSTVSGNMEGLAAAGGEEDFYQDGRLAFFAKGRIKGSWLLTMAYDSGRESKNGEKRFFQTIDPGTYYTLYGDAVQQQYEASSIRKLYLKIEREQFYALFGDFDTGLTVTELSRYSRRFNGIKSEYQGQRFGYSAFATDTNQAFIKDEIRGDGTSGLYRLSRSSLLPNSENVIIETRDRFRSEIIIASRILTRHIDYTIDYDAGTLFFKAPVYSRDQNFNPNYIVVEYESDDSGGQAYTYGGRGSTKLAGGKFEVGATYIHEGPRNAEGHLAGMDARIDLGRGLQIKAEAAATHTEEGGSTISGQGYLAEVSKQSADLDARLYYREQGEGFGLGQQNGSEAETRKIGAEAAWRLKDHWNVSGEFYRQYNLAANAERDLGEVRAQRNESSYSLYTGLRLAEDRLGDGQTGRSDQVIAGGSRRFMDDRIQARFSHEQSVGGRNESVDFPTRTILGADFKLVDPVVLFAEHEITRGAAEDTQSSRLGAKATPWRGGQIGSSVGRQMSENNQRIFANLGLTQIWRINDHWSVDGGLDRTQTVHHNDAPAFNANVPTAAGAEEDFTALSLGAGYKADLWSWNVRLEDRTSDSQDKRGLITGIAGELRKGLGLSAGLQIFQTETAAAVDTLAGDLRFSMAYRPNSARWIVLDRLAYEFENQKDVDGNLQARRIVNNLNANCRPHQRLQLSLQYGAKYVFDTIDGASYTGYTDLTGLEARYDLTAKWDMGLHAGILHSWNAGQVDYRTGLSVGYALVENTWISLGYNFSGFKDQDFSAADYTAAGPYVKFRIKVDQQSVREMVNWFAN